MLHSTYFRWCRNDDYLKIQMIDLLFKDQVPNNPWSLRLNPKIAFSLPSEILSERLIAHQLLNSPSSIK